MGLEDGNNACSHSWDAGWSAVTVKGLWMPINLFCLDVDNANGPPDAVAIRPGSNASEGYFATGSWSGGVKLCKLVAMFDIEFWITRERKQSHYQE